MKGSGTGTRAHLGSQTLPEHCRLPPPGSPPPWELASRRCRGTLGTGGLPVQPTWEPQSPGGFGQGMKALHKQGGAGNMPEHPEGALTLGVHLGHPTVAMVLEGT